jgi:hypothetical protein
MLTGFEDAHVFYVSIFGRFEHLQEGGRTGAKQKTPAGESRGLLPSSFLVPRFAFGLPADEFALALRALAGPFSSRVGQNTADGRARA